MQRDSGEGGEGGQSGKTGSGGRGSAVGGGGGEDTAAAWSPDLAVKSKDRRQLK